MDQYDLVNMWMDQYDLVNTWMDQYKVVNTWMDQYRVEDLVVVYLDIMASNGLRVKVYMVDSGHYNEEVHREFCVHYSLVRGTKEEATWIQGAVRHAGQVVDRDVMLQVYNLVRGLRWTC